MRKIVRIINDLPLPGKAWTRPLAYGLFRSKSMRSRRCWFATLLAVLILFICGHTKQAVIGIQALGHISELWIAAIAIAYIVVNLAVVLAQIVLLVRAIRFVMARRPFPRTTRSAPLYSVPVKEWLLMLLVTVGGQVLFAWACLA